MSEYPKTKYPVQGGGSITIFSADQEKKLGPEWVDHQPFREEPKETVMEVPKRRGRPPKVREGETTLQQTTSSQAPSG